MVVEFQNTINLSMLSAYGANSLIVDRLTALLTKRLIRTTDNNEFHRQLSQTTDG